MMGEGVVVHLRLPAEVAEELRRYAEERYGRRKGAVSMAAAELVRAGLSALRGGASAAAPDLERRVRELEELYAELAKAVAALEERLSSTSPAAPPAAAQPEAGAAARERRGALDVLKERGFEEEAELKRKVRDVRAVLARLAEEGAVLVKTPRGFVAVHPELWEELKRGLELCKPTDVTPLEGKARELYLLLARRGLVSYSSGRGWQLPEPLTGAKALEALGAAAEREERGEREGRGGGGAFVFKCPQCSAQLRGGSPEALAEEAGRHVWREHGVLLSTEALYRYMTRVEG